MTRPRALARAAGAPDVIVKVGTFRIMNYEYVLTPDSRLPTLTPESGFRLQVSNAVGLSAKSSRARSYVRARASVLRSRVASESLIVSRSVLISRPQFC